MNLNADFVTAISNSHKVGGTYTHACVFRSAPVIAYVCVTHLSVSLGAPLCTHTWLCMLYMCACASTRSIAINSTWRQVLMRPDESWRWADQETDTLVFSARLLSLSQESYFLMLAPCLPLFIKSHFLCPAFPPASSSPFKTPSAHPTMSKFPLSPLPSPFSPSLHPLGWRYFYHRPPVRA